MASSSSGAHESTLEAKMPIQDLDNALSQALKAAESSAEATTRGLKSALASCDFKTQKALEASQCSAQAAHDSIKAARSTLKAAKLERRPWIEAYHSFMKKVQRYWRIGPKESTCECGRGGSRIRGVQLLTFGRLLTASDPGQASAGGVSTICGTLHVRRRG